MTKELQDFWGQFRTKGSSNYSLELVRLTISEGVIKFKELPSNHHCHRPHVGERTLLGVIFFLGTFTMTA